MAVLKKNILHIITGLETGGAESMLCKLLSNRKNHELNYFIVSLMGRGTFGERIESLGIPVYSINMTRGIPSPTGFYMLNKIKNKIKPDLIQGWMYHGNIASSILGLLSKRKLPVIWNIRRSMYSIDNLKFNKSYIIKISSLLSKQPHFIINNSRTSAEQHISYGFPLSKTVVIPNGFEVDVYKPNFKCRNNVRNQYRINDDEVVISLVARYEPIKDHYTFLKAASYLLLKYKNVKFLLLGRDVTTSNRELVSHINDLELSRYVQLLGEVNDIYKILPAFDIAANSSWGEGFPNAVGEAMSCGVPCVVTDVGDSKVLIGDTGKVVPPRNPMALANAWYELINGGHEYRRKLGLKARERIEDNYSVGSIVNRYETLYNHILSGRDNPLPVNISNIN